MKFIKLEVSNFTIQKAEGINPISGSKNYFGLQFTFDNEFASLGGSKTCEFFKNRNKARVNIVDGKCMIPNEFLEDKNYFEVRILSGNTVATPWLAINVTESGAILPEEVEDLPEEYEYVKTLSGESAAPLLRESEDGLQYSADGSTWKNALNGIPDVPRNSDGKKYVRAYGDWVEAEDTGGTSESAIEEIKVNGTALPADNKSVNIDLSEYIKAADAATKEEIGKLQTLQGEAEKIAEISVEEPDASVIVEKINELIGILKARGICS